MKLAIVIGISEYDNLTTLPACKNDATIMKFLLDKSGKYNEVLYIDSNTYSYAIKNQISEFVQRYKDQEVIEELFFYFSGHGGYVEKEFYYGCTDYSISKPKTTGLNNSDLDDDLRLLHANLTIKVVDACESGNRYIKGDKEENFLKGTKAGYKDVYFMFSSQIEQSSIATDKISYFTYQFVNSIIDFPGEAIRYRDIINYISDRFNESEIEQKPFYVTQSSNIEYFIKLNLTIREEISGKLNELITILTEGEEDKSGAKNIVDLVEADSKFYTTKEEAEEKMNNIKEFLSSYIAEDENFNNLYSIECSCVKCLKVDNSGSKKCFYEYSELPYNISAIGEWIDKNKNIFFAQPTYKEENYTSVVKVEKKNKNSTLRALEAIYGPQYETREVKRKRKVITGFKLTEDVPFDTIKISIIPKYSSLINYEGYILFVFSKVDIVFFYNLGQYKDISWTEKKLDFPNVWEKSTVKWMDDANMESTIKSIIESFVKLPVEKVLEKYGLNEEREKG